MNPGTDKHSHSLFRWARQASLCLAGFVCLWTAACGGSADNASGAANSSGDQPGAPSSASGQGQVAGYSLKAVLAAKERYQEHSKLETAPLSEEWKSWSQRQKELSKEVSAVAEREYPEIFAAIRGHQKATTVLKDKVAAEILHRPFRMPVQIIDVEPAKLWARQAVFGGSDMKYMLRFSLVGETGELGMFLLYCAIPETFAKTLKKDDVVELRATLREIEGTRTFTYRFALETPETFPVRQQVAAIRKQVQETEDFKKAALLIREAGGLGPFASFDACLLWEAHLMQRVDDLFNSKLPTDEAQGLLRKLLEVDVPLMTSQSFDFQQMAIVSSEFGPILLVYVSGAIADGNFDQSKAEDLGNALGWLLAHSQAVYRDRARRHEGTNYGLLGDKAIPAQDKVSQDEMLQAGILAALAKLRSPKAVRGLQEYIGAKWPLEKLRLNAALTLAVTPGKEAAQALQALGDINAARVARQIQGLKTKFSRCLAVIGVDSGSQAEKAGIKISDAVLRYDGQSVDSLDAFAKAQDAADIAGKKQVTLVIWRDGEDKSLTVPAGKLGFQLFDVEFPKEGK